MRGAAFFGFAAVRVEDAEGALGFFGGERPEQDAVGTDAEIAVTNRFDLLGRERRGPVFRMENDIIVAQRVIF